MRELISKTAVITPGAERPRRLRTNPALRALVRETRVDPSQLIAPLFVINGHDHRHEIASLQGHFRLTPDLALREASRLADLGIGGVLLFGIPESKDAEGSGADDPRGPVAETLRGLRREGLPLVLVADVCLCEYTSHGHCGVLDGQQVDNDRSLPLLAEAALAYAEAGADLVAPSAMMDGQVGALRAGLDAAGHTGTAIMAYASKHASALYGPFREAAGSTPAFGDRRSYQMDSANGREALREMELDAREGADILMVKPAITSLDLLARARQHFELPLAAYQVSGEYAMLEAAAQRGWLDRRAASLEKLEEAASAVLRSGLGRWMHVAESLLGVIQPSQYVKKPTAQEQSLFSGERSRYLIVYPFTKSSDWYLLGREARQGIMNEHMRVGHEYPQVRQLLAYSFGIDDQDFLVAYETDDMVAFGELVRALRGTESRRSTVRDTPILIGIHRPLAEIARLLGA